MLIYDIALILDLIRNSEGTKLLILTVIFCLVFTAPAKWRVELRAKIGHYRNRCFKIFKEQKNKVVLIFSWIFGIYPSLVMSNILSIENYVHLTNKTKIIRPGRFFHRKIKVVREWPLDSLTSFTNYFIR